MFTVEFNARQIYSLCATDNSTGLHIEVITDRIDLGTAIEKAKELAKNFEAEVVDIIDPNTAEVYVTVLNFPDEEEEEEEGDFDWGYNEDVGFDPYEGCYTYDC